MSDKLKRDVSVNTDDIAEVDDDRYQLSQLWLEAGYFETPISDDCHIPECATDACSCRVGAGLNISLYSIGDFQLEPIGSGFFSTIYKVNVSIKDLLLK